MNEIINSFDGKYDFLSNFYDCDITYNGLSYKNSEAAFQAQKTLDLNLKSMFTTMTPYEAKKCGRRLNIRKDWEEIKDKVMYEICLAKFTQNSNLKKKLLDTGNAELIEGNYWHDNCWGDCNCTKCKNISGQNRLGKILMKIRDELKC